MPETGNEISEIIDNLRRVFQMVNGHSKRAERDTGLTGPQLWTIKVIADWAPIRVSDLARRIYLHPATVVGILDRLEARNLVKRVRSTTDRRVVEVELTDQGKEMVANAPSVAQGLLVAGLEGLPPERLKVISSALGEMVAILGAQEIPAQLMMSPEFNRPRKRAASKSPQSGEDL